MEQIKEASTARGGNIPTLREVWSHYQQTRKLKPTTLRNYEMRLNHCCSDWLDIPMTSITKDMVQERHRSIKGEAMANSTMRTIKALYHYAAYKYVDLEGKKVIQDNPVYRLSEERVWFKEKTRTRVLRKQELANFVRAIFSLQNPTARDMLLILLLTGMRSGEVRTLRWEHVNMLCGVITLPDTETKTGQPYVIPLSDYVWQMFRNRQYGSVSDYVFPGRTPEMPLTRSEKSLNTVRQRSGIEFSPHDLRRSFVTFGDELEIKHQILKCLINHKQTDETELYIQPSIERLRRCTQQITDYILICAQIRQPRTTL